MWSLKKDVKKRLSANHTERSRKEEGKKALTWKSIPNNFERIAYDFLKVTKLISDT